MIYSQKKNVQSMRFERRSLVLIFTLLLMLLLHSCTNTVAIAGINTTRDTVSLDLRSTGVTSAGSLKGIRKLHDLTALDLRDNPLTVEAHDEISRLIPKCYIRWSVPLTQGTIDSASDTLSLSSFEQSDIALLTYFPHCTSLDAPDGDPAALIAAEAKYPNITFTWTVTIAGRTYSSEETEVVCSEKANIADVERLLVALPKVQTLDMRQTNLLVGEVSSLQIAYPEVCFLVNAMLQGVRLDTNVSEANLSDTTRLDTKTLIDELANFPNFALLDLRGLPVTEGDVASLTSAYPSLHVRWDVPILDNLFVDSDIESLDIRGYTVSDLASFQKQLRLLT